MTPAAVLSRAVELHFGVLGQFDNVTTPTGVHIDRFIVFEVGDRWDLVAFNKDEDTGPLCYAGYQSVDENELDEFLVHVTRKAGPSI